MEVINMRQCQHVIYTSEEGFHACGCDTTGKHLIVRSVATRLQYEVEVCDKHYEQARNTPDVGN